MFANSNKKYIWTVSGTFVKIFPFVDKGDKKL